MIQARLLPVLLALSILTAHGSAADGPADPLFGTWLTGGGESRVEIAPCADAICGTIVWLKTPQRDGGGPVLDTQNDDRALRDREILGLRIMEGFRPAASGGLDEGTIYNPEDGNTYEPSFTPQTDGTLELEACVLFFCQTQTWIRVE